VIEAEKQSIERSYFLIACLVVEVENSIFVKPRRKSLSNMPLHEKSSGYVFLFKSA
jgi:hypothetical protein